MARLFTGYTKYKLTTSIGIQNQAEDKDTSSFGKEDVCLNGLTVGHKKVY